MEEYLRKFGLLSEQEITAFVNAGSLRSLNKHDHFIQQDQISQEVAFVISGFFRSYYCTPQGNEITYCFTFERNFLTAYSSFLTHTPTVENIRAETQSELFVIPAHWLSAREEQSINWLRLAKTIAQQEYLKMEQRVFGLLKESAPARYDELMRQHPEYINQIPLGQLASYLGITQRHLSRIRRSVTF